LQTKEEEMLSRVAQAGRPHAVKHLGALAAAPARGFATEQQLKARIKSVANIEKITKAMKMVAAAKLRRVQNHLDVARDFQADIMSCWPEPSQEALDQAGDGKSQHLIIGITADKGLCGAVNSTIIRNVRDKLKTEECKDADVLLFGDKARLGLERLYGGHFKETAADIGKLRVKSFAQASALADMILNAKYTTCDIVYNRFKNMLAYETTTIKQHPLEVLCHDNPSQFEGRVIGAMDVYENLYEFRMGVQMYHLLAETDTSELSARMNAMGNSSQNAADMLSDLNLLYNRTRQAKITTELIEIISGASAAAEQVSN
jgi:F-type H+-transporting ATPase subunit gamma